MEVSSQWTRRWSSLWTFLACFCPFFILVKTVLTNLTCSTCTVKVCAKRAFHWKDERKTGHWWIRKLIYFSSIQVGQFFTLNSHFADLLKVFQLEQWNKNSSKKRFYESKSRVEVHFLPKKKNKKWSFKLAKQRFGVLMRTGQSYLQSVKWE